MYKAHGIDFPSLLLVVGYNNQLEMLSGLSAYPSVILLLNILG